MKGSGESRLGWVVLEAALVVFGLVGAWLASEWQSARSDRNAAKSARVAIVAELSENRDRIIEARNYHAGIVATLQPQAANPQARPNVYAIFSGGFVSPAEVVTVAWQAAGATGVVSDFEQSEVLEFASVYAGLQRYHEAGGDVGAIIYRALYEEGTQGVFGNWRGILPLATSLVYQECGILATLDEFLASEIELAEDPDAEVCDFMLRGGAATEG